MHKKRVRRPWGFYTVINHGKNFKVKLVEVLPGKRLSLQRHDRRSEHWVVVSGKAKIVNGGNILILSENQSTYIPTKTLHRLENPNKKSSLKIVEIQCGAYTGEDDIVRFSDDYGRTPR
ncbi:MAG: cupin domain-containing protein [Candidatus Omnitrophica bacterium]|nr:cupin domain-containing protein [Candidatus Omnitrophota bacterium]